MEDPISEPERVEPARVTPVASLSGNWLRNEKHIFRLEDDGTRVRGTWTDSKAFREYQIDLQWTAPQTLEGTASWTLDFRNCTHQDRTRWRINLSNADNFTADVEIVDYDFKKCRPKGKRVKQYTFRRLPTPVTNLTGLWERTGGSKFRLTDNGVNVTGIWTDNKVFKTYKVNLRWTSSTTLEGDSAWLLELKACHHETTTGWQMTVTDADTLAGNLEMVAYDVKKCVEKNRYQKEYGFIRIE